MVKLMKNKNCRLVSDAIITSMQQGWKLKELTWNYDLGATPSTAKKFLGNLSELKDSQLEVVELVGVF